MLWLRFNGELYTQDISVSSPLLLFVPPSVFAGNRIVPSCEGETSLDDDGEPPRSGGGRRVSGGASEAPVAARRGGGAEYHRARVAQPGETVQNLSRLSLCWTSVCPAMV